MEFQEQPQAPVVASVTLETLSAYVRRQILFLFELEDLGALIRASPVYLQQFLVDRHSLLRNSLELSLGSVTIDACAAYRSWVPTFERSAANLDKLLTSFLRRRHFSESYSIRGEHLTHDEIVGLAAFHGSVVRPIAREYFRWAASGLHTLFGDRHRLRQDLPTKTERTRILRALYRFQLYCNLFGTGNRSVTEAGADGLLDTTWPSMEAITAFYHAFHAWEIEEIICITAFAHNKYADVYWETFPAEKMPGHRLVQVATRGKLDPLFLLWYELWRRAQ
jgi:hypothetical protein